MLNNFKSKDIRLAKVKRFDYEKNGIEVNGLDAYAFLYLLNGKYVNIFDITNDLPVFERVPYSNTTKDGESFGTKVIQLSGEANESGPCYVLTDETALDLFDLEIVTEKMLKKYILHSSKFFVDRKNIMEDELTTLERARRLPQILDDQRKMRKLEAYLYPEENNNHKGMN